MLEAKILTGKTNAELAKDFGVGPEVVRRALTLAERAEIVVKFEDKLYNDLLPASFEAVQTALQGGGDVALAKIGLQVLTGTQVLRPTAQRSAIQAQEDDELALYVAAKRKQAELQARTVEAEYVHSTVNEAEGTRNLLPSHGPATFVEEGAPEDGEDGAEDPQVDAPETDLNRS
jgi:hypothetical protein